MIPCSVAPRTEAHESNSPAQGRHHEQGASEMVLELAIGFFVLAIIAGVVGQQGTAGLSMRIARWLVIIFVVLAIISFLL